MQCNLSPEFALSSLRYKDVLNTTHASNLLELPIFVLTSNGAQFLPL